MLCVIVLTCNSFLHFLALFLRLRCDLWQPLSCQKLNFLLQKRSGNTALAQICDDNAVEEWSTQSDGGSHRSNKNRGMNEALTTYCLVKPKGEQV